jgi:hypothetical protein
LHDFTTLYQILPSAVVAAVFGARVAQQAGGTMFQIPFHKKMAIPG